MYNRKTRVYKDSSWSHHRGGWPTISSYLYDMLNNDDSQVDFYTNLVEQRWVESDQVAPRPWLGFLHLTPGKFINHMLQTNPAWIMSLQKCLGLFTFSNYVKNAIQPMLPVLVEKLIHPTELPTIEFSMDRFLVNSNKKVLFIGHWLRNFDAFFQLQSAYSKVIIAVNDYCSPNTIVIQPYLSNTEYDGWLSENVVFLNLIDSSANNTVIECIVRNTPIIINRLPALEEYLGKDYPCFYDNMDEANRIIDSIDKLEAGYKYLRNMNKSIFTIDYFIKSVANSYLYKKIGVDIKL